MDFLKNKHLVLAMFIAPVLAIIAYFATDYIVSEEPQRAEQGAHYKLAARSNCRYESGQCTLVNGDVEINIHAERIDARRVNLTATSDLPINKAVVAHVLDERELTPQTMQRVDGGGSAWHVQLDIEQPENSRLRLAFTIDGAVYYIETSAVFVDYETSFPRENFPS